MLEVVAQCTGRGKLKPEGWDQPQCFPAVSCEAIAVAECKSGHSKRHSSKSSDQTVFLLLGGETDSSGEAEAG